MRLLNVITLIVALIMPVLIISYVSGFGADLLFFNETRSDISATSPPISPYVMSVVMIVGVLFGAIYRILDSAKKSEVLRAFKGLFDNPDLYKSLLAAPLVFSGVYTLSKSVPDPIVALFLAFQNGFFCDA